MGKKVVKGSEKELEVIKRKINLIEHKIKDDLSFVESYGRDLKTGLNQINEIFDKIVGKKNLEKKN